MSGLKLWEDIFLLNLVLLFGEPKFRFRSGKTVQCLKCWKCGNCKMWLYSPWMSNNQMVHFISSYPTVLQHLPLLEYMQLPQIDKYTSKLCSWNLGQMIQSCLYLLCLVCKKNWFTCYQREGKQERGEEKGWEIWPQHLRSHKMFQEIFVCCLLSRQIIKAPPSQKKLFTRPW